jgi:hypothetical protein
MTLVGIFPRRRRRTPEETDALIDAGVAAREAIRSLDARHRTVFEDLAFGASPADTEACLKLVDLGLAQTDSDAPTFTITGIAHMTRFVCFDAEGRPKR